MEYTASASPVTLKLAGLIVPGPLKMLPTSDTVPCGVSIFSSFRAGGNLPKFNCDVSVAEKMGIISAMT
jgi:hypothetical protein